MKLPRIILGSIMLLFSIVVCAQQHYRFGKEIDAYKKNDIVNPPPQHAILFTGSSSIRAWKDVNDYFPGYTIINRGFGGSTLPELIHYANDIIFPYHAKQILIYCGANDLEDTLNTPEIVLKNTQKLFKLIREHDSNVNILFVGVKPSPRHRKIWPALIKTNTLINDYMKHVDHASFINVWEPMLHADGTANREIFLKDMLHMNADGYKIWQRIITPYLLK